MPFGDIWWQQCMHDMFLYIWYISCDMFFSATVCFETHIIHPWGCIRKYNALTWLTLAHTMDHSVPILCKLFVTFLEAASACVAWKSVSINMVWYRLQSIKLHSRIQCVYIEVCISAILLLAPFTPRYALHTQTPLCAMPIKSDYFYSAFFAGEFDLISKCSERPLCAKFLGTFHFSACIPKLEHCSALALKISALALRRTRFRGCDGIWLQCKFGALTVIDGNCEIKWDILKSNVKLWN